MSDSYLDDRELRIAPVMTGGTSLSVWMGGATVELYAMLREGEARGGEPDAAASVYQQLCSLTRTVPVVDVITGTSAGGLNGTLLAAGVAYRVPQNQFSQLRETWMDVADILSLMRDLDGDDAPESLLNGKEKFRDKVADVLSGWRGAAEARVLKEPDFVDLVTTYTCIEPRDESAIDDFGEEMSEVRYAGTLRFTHDDFKDVGKQPGIVAKLAHAAKASASLPGVFEPSQLSWWGDGDDPYDPTQPHDPPNLFGNVVAETASSGSQFVVDGGVVVNMPLTEALDRIYNRPNDTLVRRVVLYVSPTPKALIRTHGPGRHARCCDPVPTTSGQDDQGEEPPAQSRLTSPKLREAVITVVTAPRAEGISTDLSDIEQHNRDVRQQRSTRSTLGWLMSQESDPDPRVVPTKAEHELMALYRDARAEDSIASLFDRLRPVVGMKVPVDPKLVKESLVRARREQLPTSLSTTAFQPHAWTWGVAPVEESVSLLASILNRVLGLPLTELDEPPSNPRLKEIYTRLRHCKALLQDVAETCKQIRRYDDQFWAIRLAKLAAEDDDGLDVEELEQFARAGFAVWPALTTQERGGSPAVSREEVLEEVREGFLTLARVVRDLHPLVKQLLDAAGVDRPEDGLVGRRLETRGEALALARELAAIRSDQDLDVIGRSLLRLHVMQTVMIGRLQQREQRVEMLQVSWNTPDYVTGREAKEKLVGPELARLGAFLKPSWRANDFFWGRMDAAPRLLELLVEPRRLVQLGVSSQELCERLGISPGPELVTELAFLDSPELSTPHRLPRLVQLLARRRQLEIAREELPHIAATIGAADTSTSRRLAGAIPEQARRFRAAAAGLDRDPSDARVEAVLCSMRVGEESLASEATSPLLKHVVRSASALTIDALLAPTSGIQVPGAIRHAIRWGRRPIVGYVAQWLVRRFNQGEQPRTYTCHAEASAASPVERAPA